MKRARGLLLYGIAPVRRRIPFLLNPSPAAAAASSSSSSCRPCSMGMMCKDSVPEQNDGCFSMSAYPQMKLHFEQHRLYGTEVVLRRKWCMEGTEMSFQSYLFRDYFVGGQQIRRMSTGDRVQKKEKKKKKKKRSKRDLVKKLKQIRWVANIKKKNMDHEQKLLARIERAHNKIVELREILKKYELPPPPMPDHDPESLTAEELHYLKRLGYKHRNYLIIGVRGVFGGVIQNMHLHWKKHQLVKVRCKNFTKEEIRDTAEQLARLSGGIVVDVQQGHTIVMYRGKNYTRPADLIPKNTLTKRKALLKARHEQSLESFIQNIEALEKELKLYREHKAQEAAGVLPQEDVCSQLDVATERHIRSWSDSDEPDADPALVCESDSVFESDSDSLDSDIAWNEAGGSPFNPELEMSSDSNDESGEDCEAEGPSKQREP